jgi:hypothetical protein
MSATSVVLLVYESGADTFAASDHVQLSEHKLFNNKTSTLWEVTVRAHARFNCKTIFWRTLAILAAIWGWEPEIQI